MLQDKDVTLEPTRIMSRLGDRVLRPEDHEPLLISASQISHVFRTLPVVITLRSF